MLFSVPFRLLWYLLKNGPQITLPYSKCGRRSALYKSGNVLLSITAKDFFINPNTDFPFLMAIAVCLWNLSSLSINTPKSFSSSTCSSYCPFISYLWCGLCLPRCKLLHLPISAHVESLFKSRCSIMLSSFDLTLLKILASSANSWHMLST